MLCTTEQMNGTFHSRLSWTTQLALFPNFPTCSMGFSHLLPNLAFLWMLEYHMAPATVDLRDYLTVAVSWHVETIGQMAH